MLLLLPVQEASGLAGVRAGGKKQIRCDGGCSVISHELKDKFNLQVEAAAKLCQ